MDIKSKKIGIIGTGKMGQSLLRGILAAGLSNPEDVYASDVYEPSLNSLRDELGINISTENADIASHCNIVIIAVKPQVIKTVLRDINPYLENKLLISIAAGITTEAIEAELDEDRHVIRVMPNIAATVGEAASAICTGKNASVNDAEIAMEIFNCLGVATLVPEHLMDAVTGLSGSGPAYIFPVIEALADGAVYEGLDRENALKLAAQTVLGAAKMVLETGMHPGELKDMVTSPAGTTIRAMHVLEQNGIRSAFMDAVIKSSERSKELGK
ncbi:pyrroline-5-carboxylate reductase [Methanohalophilus sp.]|uniref:pyrroline-5-carboxylate reductase n=1 Tax=Methanohalophilus sp. TaxID=1966352 RepID=UPI0026259D27|nr:pyrroline-5-carboxylate reductase [Methanohalophilus sp.]MDK2891633.1 pyrroline-5-carboxylate reductase [Methanohalophilus sp.]